ncbi:MAG: cupredoxin domain-containing protein [Chloroflexi bacterium]|nr:cupredoxin domain-containing protein [Chloroflexota bacterium]
MSKLRVSRRCFRSLVVTISALVVMAIGSSAPFAAAPASAQGRIVDVTMGDHFFSPYRQVVSLGDTVRWENHGDAPHNVTSEPRSFPASRLIRPNGSYQYTFTQAGEYPYVCTLHRAEEMAGVIVVQAPPSVNRDKLLYLPFVSRASAQR